MASAMTALATLTLGTAQATVTFSAIPATYRDLRLVVTIPTGYAGSGSGVKFNTDTDYTNNYSRVVMGGNGSSAYSFSNSGSGNPTANHDLGALRADGNLIVDFLDYSATDKHKTVLGRENGAANEAAAQVTRWASTAAITTITLTTDGSPANLPAGSVFSLYGILA
jgi:hypothetical protein